MVIWASKTLNFSNRQLNREKKDIFLQVEYVL